MTVSATKKNAEGLPLFSSLHSTPLHSRAEILIIFHVFRASPREKADIATLHTATNFLIRTYSPLPYHLSTDHHRHRDLVILLPVQPGSQGPITMLKKKNKGRRDRSRVVYVC